LISCGDVESNPGQEENAVSFANRTNLGQADEDHTRNPKPKAFEEDYMLAEEWRKHIVQALSPLNPPVLDATPYSGTNIAMPFINLGTVLNHSGQTHPFPCFLQ